MMERECLRAKPKKIPGIEGSYFPNSKSWLPGFQISAIVLNYRPMADDRW